MSFSGLSGAPGRMIARNGETFTLRKATTAAGPNSYTAGATTLAYSTARGRLRFYRSSEIKGGITERDRLLVMDPASTAIVPAAGDKVAAGAFTSDVGAVWLQIVNVYAVRLGARTVAYRIQVRE